MVTNFLEALPKHVLEESKNMSLSIRSVRAHEAIDAVLSQSVLKGGKRLRPLLTYLVANVLKVDFNKVAPFARSTELVHAASLSHDDVIDNATMRRGSPSINILSSNQKAVLAGDYLLALVIVDLTNQGNLDLVKEMSLVIKDLSEGEWLQLDLISERTYTRELIAEIAKKKTSSVMSYCCIAPAILGGVAPEMVEEFREFGNRLGLAFQLIDDTLDYSGDSQKDQELDLKNNIVNAVVFEYLDDHQDLFSKYKDGQNLLDLLKEKDFSNYVEIISKKAHEHLEVASMKLDIIQKYLEGKNPSWDHEELAENINSLRLIISYMALRKN